MKAGAGEARDFSLPGALPPWSDEWGPHWASVTPLSAPDRWRMLKPVAEPGAKGEVIEVAESLIELGFGGVQGGCVQDGHGDACHAEVDTAVAEICGLDRCCHGEQKQKTGCSGAKRVE